MQENKGETTMLEQFRANRIAVTVNEPMSKHTSFQIGGPADYFVCPANQEQLKTAVEIIKSAGIPYFVFFFKYYKNNRRIRSYCKIIQTIM